MKKLRQSQSIDAERERRHRQRAILDYQTDKLITFQKITRSPHL
ncbi:hypothetical protein AGMMS49990_09430 [Endomicrobiia bacterium]|nr:hypothetical protein AGMMS49990_09360 [Endomicrobiia bacterium]GHT52717.1 hypothetical protein AGMMS49990_09430 [Endomicrobiia bacterium]